MPLPDLSLVVILLQITHQGRVGHGKTSEYKATTIANREERDFSFVQQKQKK